MAEGGGAEAPRCERCADKKPCGAVKSTLQLLHSRAGPASVQSAVQQLRDAGHAVPREAGSAYIRALTSQRKLDEALDALQTVQPDSRAIDSVIRGLIADRRLHAALDLLRWAASYRLSPTERTECCLVYWLGGNGDMDSGLRAIALRESYGRKVLGQLYHSLVRGLANGGYPRKAEEVVEMLGADRYSLERQSLAGQSGSKLKPLQANYDPILAAYAALGMIRDAQRTLGRMKWRGVKPSTRAFNHVIKAASRAGNCSAALSVLRELEGGGSYDVEALGIEPDEISYCTAMDCLARKGSVDSVRELMQRMESVGQLELDTTCWGTLIKAYAYANKPQGAEAVLQEMEQYSCLKPTNRCFTSVVAAYAFVGDIDSAWRIVQTMKADHVLPNHVTYGHIIFACGKEGVAPQAAQVLTDMVKVGLHPTLKGDHIQNCVRDAYERNNLSHEQADELVEKAIRLFEHRDQIPAEERWPLDSEKHSNPVDEGSIDAERLAAAEIQRSTVPTARLEAGSARPSSHIAIGHWSRGRESQRKSRHALCCGRARMMRALS